MSTEGFSVVEVEVKHSEGLIRLYVKCIENILGMPPIIDFCIKPWEADRPVLCNDLLERVYHELSQEKATHLFQRLCTHTDVIRNQTVQVNRVNVTLDGWNVTTEISKRSPTLAIQPMDLKENKIIVLNF